ncbi:helix-turn-helix domain-containing protein [Psychromicrobium silvestre]
MRALMRQENLSIGALATDAKCSKGFISHLLAGRRTSCTAGLAARICQVLGVPLTVLFEMARPVDPDALTRLRKLNRLPHREPR